MKKLIVIALAICGMSVMAASEYMVYDFTMSAKTTKAKGKTSTSCGDEYVWRDSGAQKVRGVIAGCGCPSILANGSCENALVLLWNETTKQQITNYTFSTWVVQRIGKKGEKAEHMAKIETDEFEVTLAGLGTYKSDHVSVSGNFAGVAAAPYLLTRGSCTACAVTPDTEDQTVAVAPCEDGICTAADNSDTTPFYGSYSLKYNQSKSKKASKSGITAKVLGTPAYVDIESGFFD